MSKVLCDIGHKGRFIALTSERNRCQIGAVGFGEQLIYGESGYALFCALTALPCGGAAEGKVYAELTKLFGELRRVRIAMEQRAVPYFAYMVASKPVHILGAVAAVYLHGHAEFIGELYLAQEHLVLQGLVGILVVIVQPYLAERHALGVR